MMKALPDSLREKWLQPREYGFELLSEHLARPVGLQRPDSRIDNGPMEGFWGILKRERYYGRHFGSKKELVHMIESYIRYYNNRRVQRNLGVLTPMEKHNLYLAA